MSVTRLSPAEEPARLEELRSEQERLADLSDRVDRAREMSSWLDERRAIANRRARVSLRGGVTVTLNATYSDVSMAVSDARRDGAELLVFPSWGGDEPTRIEVADVMGVYEVRP